MEVVCKIWFVDKFRFKVFDEEITAPHPTQVDWIWRSTKYANYCLLANLFQVVHFDIEKLGFPFFWANIFVTTVHRVMALLSSCYFTYLLSCSTPLHFTS